MRFIINTETDPFFNLALEEFLLKELPFESCMLWVSQPSIVVGKHQNALSEVNYPMVYRRDITVARRLSGGGTVFHGPGNLNFTFVRDGEPGKLIDFKRHTLPVIEFLNSLGVPARFEGKNDLRVKGLKISGNAEHIYKHRVLHHGTLLYDASLDTLNEAIRVAPRRYHDKSVQSVRSKVANIRDFLSDPPAFDTFRDLLLSWLKDYFSAGHDGQARRFSDYLPGKEMLDAVRRLAAQKYSTWEWIYGYSPDYTFSGAVRHRGLDLRLSMKVSKGFIREAAITGDDADVRWISLAGLLPGKRHNVHDILPLLQHFNMTDEGSQRFPESLMPLFF